MQTLLKRLAISAFAAAAALTPLAGPAQASTGSWSWSDVSSLIAERQNRPVWAMAYASPYWYLTDGQDLWNGGHVWLSEGSMLSDITLDVRNAGISRVDDITSNGQSVIFFKDVFRLDNQVQAVMYRNGSYTNITSYIRLPLAYNEGISSIVGRNGMWIMVTTRARLVRFSDDFSSYYYLTAPSNLVQLSSSNEGLQYSSHNRFDRITNGIASAGIAIAPVGNKFLLAMNDQYQKSGSLVEYYLYDGSSFTSLTRPSTSNSYVYGIAYNQTQALVITDKTRAAGSDGLVYTFDGSTWGQVGNSWYGVGYGTNSTRLFDVTSNFQAVYDGYDWMIFSGKKVFRISNSYLEQLDSTRDYFVSAASNGSGTVMLGGAESTEALSSPSSPLTAKLVKVTRGSSNSNNNNSNSQNVTTSNGISSWQWLEPNQTYIRRDQTMSYNVGAWSDKGIKRIEITVNGTVRRTCDLGVAYGNQTCSYTLYGSDYPLNTNVSFNAKITDGSDQTVWTSLQTINVTDTNGTNNTNTNGDISTWAWLDPTNSTLNRSSNATLRVQANATQGLNRVEVYVNGNIRRTCDFSRVYGTQSCDLTIYGSEYTSGSQLALNAKATDYNGKTAWSDMRYLNITDNGSNQNTNGNLTITNWLEPSNSTLGRNSSANLRVQANATQGLNRVEVYVNGNIRRTCDFSRVYGTQSCDVSIYGGDYTSGSQLAMNAKMTDYNGNTAWSGMVYMNITDSGSNQGNTPTYWLSPQDKDVTTGENFTFTVGANDADGIQRLEILVNDNKVQTCTLSNATGDQQCTYQIYVNNYTANNGYLYIGANVVDRYGNVFRTGNKAYHVTNFGSNQNNNSNTNSNTATWVWSVPETGELKTNASAIYNVGAWDQDGLQKIEILVNGSVNNTCNYGTAYGNRECSTTLNGSNYPANTDVFVNAKVTDIYGNITWANSRSYRVVSATTSGGTTGQVNTPTQTWVWSDPEKSTLNAGESATYFVGAWDNEALQRIEIWVNGQVKQTCQYGNAYGNRECSYTVRANDYPVGTSVFVNAAVIDGLGNTTWSASRQYAIASSVSGPTGTTYWPDNLPGNISVSSNADNGFANNQTVTFTASANDQDGINRIDLMVNASLVKTCYNQNTCSYTGGPYNERTSVSYGAKIVDNKGFALWTGYRTIYKK